MAQENTVRAVERALQILNCFAGGKESFTLMEIARAIELSPSTTLRIIGTLEKENYIYRNPDSMRYYLGFKLAQISHVGFANLDVCKIAHPQLEHLAELFGESTGLYLRKGERRICVDRVEGTRSLRSVVQVGNSAPLVRGASGRLLLSSLADAQIETLLQKDPCTTLENILKIRAAGYAVSHGEREPGVVSVAAPVYDSTGAMIAAVFVTGPEPRLDDKLVQRMIPEIVAAAENVSMQLGCSQSDDHHHAKQNN